MRVETSPIYDPNVDGIPQFYEWSTIGPDGVTEASPISSGDCHSATAFANELRPSAKYRGEVAVDTANPTGQLVLGNLVWNYPA